LLDGERHFERYRCDGLDQQLANHVVDTSTIDDLTGRLATLDPSALTAIRRYIASVKLVIAYCHAFAADGADSETLQQRWPFARRTFLSLRSKRIGVVP